MEQRFIDAINADPDDRVLQLVYADWLDEQGDPRAEAWRVLIEAGKRPGPDYFDSGLFVWWSQRTFSVGDHDWLDDVIPNSSRFLSHGGNGLAKDHQAFFSAMNAAAVAWVRCHRDPEFDPLGMMGV